MLQAGIFLIISFLSSLRPLAAQKSPVDYSGFSGRYSQLVSQQFSEFSLSLVVSVVPQTDSQVRWLERSSCKALNDWVGVGQPAHLLCDRKQARQLRNNARRRGMETQFVSKHLGREIKEEAKTIDNIEDGNRRGRTGVRRVKVKKKKQRPTRLRHNSYLGTQLLYSFLTELETQYDTMTMENIGKTAEGRDVKIVKINANNTDLPVIFIDAGIHAR